MLKIKNNIKFDKILLLWILSTSIWAQSEIDPTVCRPLDECVTLCQKHLGNQYADFAIPGKECICPACNTIKK